MVEVSIKMKLHLNNGDSPQAVSLVFQVIIKKFQIPCPLLPVDDAVNETLVTLLNSSFDQQDSKAVDYSDDACTPKYFVFNSQVTQTLPAIGRKSILISELRDSDQVFRPLSLPRLSTLFLS